MKKNILTPCAIDTFEYESFTSAIRRASFWERLRFWWSKPELDTAPSGPAPDPAEYSPCVPEERLNEYRQLLGAARSIYVFRNGTAVYSAEAMSEAEAVELLKEHGGVQQGTPSGDFHVAVIESPVSGIVVKYWHAQIVSFAGSTEYPPDFPKYLAGSMLRLSREMDSYDLCVVARYAQSNSE